MESISQTGAFSYLGTYVINAILAAAARLADKHVPGLIAAGLLVSLVVVCVFAGMIYARRLKAVTALAREVAATSQESFANERDSIGGHLGKARSNSAKASLAAAWQEFDETLATDDRDGQARLRNAMRPSVFFNLEDLHFGLGIFRILPGLFVSVGLGLTFLGLIGALNEMAGGQIDNATMARLLGIASAKFIMSLTGLVCSIILTIVLRIMTGRLDAAIHQLCATLEDRLSFASLEQIALEQLKAQRDMREFNQALAAEMVSNLSRPLREELPAAISRSISTTMQPLLDKISQQGTDSVSSMAANLSEQMSTGVASALSQASTELAHAGERIGQLAERMDQSSGRMGGEMEQAVARVALAVDELRGAMTGTAEKTSDAFSAGADQLLAAMNGTLEGIRENTAASAEAMTTAAAEMRGAATAMRSEMEGAARDGAAAAQARMQTASQDAEGAIGAASRSVLDAFGTAGAEIARLAEGLSAKAGRDLLDPLGRLSGQLDAMVGQLTQGASDFRRISDSLRDGAGAGAEAALSFRGASQDLVAAAAPMRATSERIEQSLRQFADGTRNAVETVTRSAEDTAAASARTLQAAETALGAQQQGIVSSLAGVTLMLGRMQGQGERLDTIDEKLGAAFDIYTTQTEQSMEMIRGHVQEMSTKLAEALSTLQTIVDTLQTFEPQQTRQARS